MQGELRSSLLEDASQFAMQGRWENILEMMAAHNEVVRAVDGFGKSLLHYVCCYGGAAPVVEMAIKLGADVNLECSEGASPLGVAISGGHRYGLTTDENVRLLLAAGASLDAPAQNGFPPLLWAVYENNVLAVKQLLEAGASTSQRNIYGETAMELATKMRLAEIKAILE
jgi:ankyrin repeat protein